MLNTCHIVSYFILTTSSIPSVHVDSARFGVVMELALDSLKEGCAVRAGSSRWLFPTMVARPLKDRTTMMLSNG